MKYLISIEFCAFVKDSSIVIVLFCIVLGEPLNNHQSMPNSDVPTAIQVIDHEGRELSRLSVYRYTVIPAVRTVCSESDVTWSISPELPAGLTYSYGVIKGEAQAIFPATQFNITATNAAGSASILFTIEIIDCPYGEFLFPVVNPRGRLYLKQQEKIVYYKELGWSDRDAICIPRSETTFEFTCTSTNGEDCTFVMTGESGLTYKALYIPVKNSQTGLLEFVPTDVPIPSTLVNPVYIVPNVDSSIFLSASTIHGNFTFIPTLPETLSFDPSRSLLKGTWKESGMHLYTISCSNAMGKGSFVLRVGVDVCEGDLHLVHFVRDEGVSETFNLTNSKGDVVYDRFSNTNPLTVNLCIPDEDYTIHLYQKDMTTSNIPLYLYDDHELLGIYEFPRSQGETHIAIPLRRVVAEGSRIRYCRDRIQEMSWIQPAFNDEKWSEGTVGNWGEFDDTVKEVYFRKHISFSDKHYGTVLVKLLVEGGVTMYVNGAKVFEEMVDKVVWKRLTLPASLFDKSINVVAVMLTQLEHEKSSIIRFDLVCQPFFESKLLRSNEGTATDDQEHPDPSHPASHAFVDNDYWKITSIPASLTFTFGLDRAVAVNEIQFFKNGELGITVRVEGILNNRTSIVLASPEPYIFLGIGLRNVSFPNTHAFSSYRLVIQSGTPGSLYIKSTRFYAHNVLTCSSQGGIPAQLTGSVLYQHCPLGQAGIRQLYCVEKANQAAWVDDRSGCVARHPESGIAYIETAFRLWNVTMDQWRDGVVNVQATLVELLTRNLTLRTEEIRYTSIRDTSFGSTLQIDFNLLFTLEEEVALFVKHHTDVLVGELDMILRKKYHSSCPDIHIEVLHGPDLYQPLHLEKYLRDVIYLSIILILLVVICIIQRKNRNRNHKEQIDKKLIDSMY